MVEFPEKKVWDALLEVCDCQELVITRRLDEHFNLPSVGLPNWQNTACSCWPTVACIIPILKHIFEFSPTRSHRSCVLATIFDGDKLCILSAPHNNAPFSHYHSRYSFWCHPLLNPWYLMPSHTPWAHELETQYLPKQWLTFSYDVRMIPCRSTSPIFVLWNPFLTSEETTPEFFLIGINDPPSPIKAEKTDRRYGF